MQDNEQVYLIAKFTSPQQLSQAAQALIASQVAHNHLAVLGNGSANNLAQSLEVGTELNSDIALDDVTQERLRWYRDNESGPLLAVQVMASQGRDIRLQLTELGGEMIDAPNLDLQVNDLDVDPGMETEDPDMPLTYGRLSDNNSSTGAPEDE